MDIGSGNEENQLSSVAKPAETICGTEVHTVDFSLNATAEQSIDEPTLPPQNENPKNPMLLTPVIRCVLQFLNIKEIKKCRFVSHEWGSAGKLVLANRALIHFEKHKRRPARLPGDFYSSFLDSASLFSAFKFSGYFKKNTRFKVPPWTIEELTKFFAEQQKYLKELTLKFEFSDNFDEVKNIDISPWISKSPMVQKDAKCLTKLSIEGDVRMLDIPLSLIAHIKDLTLSHCRINLESGIKICPIKLKLKYAKIFQDGNKLDPVRINDFVDFSKAKEVSLHCTMMQREGKYVLDFWGNGALENLVLENVDIVNGETSQWVIEHLSTTDAPYSLNRQIQIKELYLSRVGTSDLSTLPNSIQKLVLDDVCHYETVISCSQPITLENLKYLHICEKPMAFPIDEPDYSFLSHFVNCPQLNFLKLNGCSPMKLESHWMPKSLKTLQLENTTKHWLAEGSWNLEKLVIDVNYRNAKRIHNCKNIQVDDLVMYDSEMDVDKDLLDFLEHRKRFRFGKRLFIGELKWGRRKRKKGALEKYVDVKSPFYVFENGEKGRAISRKDFYDLIPKHIDVAPEEY